MCVGKHERQRKKWGERNWSGGMKGGELWLSGRGQKVISNDIGKEDGKEWETVRKMHGDVSSMKEREGVRFKKKNSCYLYNQLYSVKWYVATVTKNK